MPNPHLQKYADRFKELISEGEALSKGCQRATRIWDVEIGSNGSGNWDTAAVFAWVTKSTHAINAVFGSTSSHFNLFTRSTAVNPFCKGPIDSGTGCLRAALSDLEGGFVKGQEFAIASGVFANVLEQAKYLNDHHFKDPAAVLMRVVLEDALKRMTREEGLDDTLKAAMLNQNLWKAERYNQPQWNMISAWLTIGNKAAHGEFGEYNEADVQTAISGVEQFLATHFN